MAGDDLDTQIAVTKNDMKHLEQKFDEFKDDIKAEFKTIHEVLERSDDRYVKKEEYERDKAETTRKQERLYNRMNIIIGAVLAWLLSYVGKYIFHWG